jgi:hypothetical protein
MIDYTRIDSSEECEKHVTNMLETFYSMTEKSRHIKRFDFAAWNELIDSHREVLSVYKHTKTILNFMDSMEMESDEAAMEVIHCLNKMAGELKGSHL